MGASSDLEASVFCGFWRSTSSSAVVFTACGLVLCSRCRVHVQARQNPRRSAALEHLGVHVRCPSLHSGGLFECMRLCALPMPCCSTSKFPALHRPPRQPGNSATRRGEGPASVRHVEAPGSQGPGPFCFHQPQSNFCETQPCWPSLVRTLAQPCFFSSVLTTSYFLSLATMRCWVPMPARRLAVLTLTR